MTFTKEQLETWMDAACETYMTAPAQFMYVANRAYEAGKSAVSEPVDVNCVCGAVWEVRGKEVELVHTPPAEAKREPLTDEQIDDGWENYVANKTKSTHTAFTCGVKFSESAHNIGAKE